MKRPVGAGLAFVLCLAVLVAGCSKSGENAGTADRGDPSGNKAAGGSEGAGAGADATQAAGHLLSKNAPQRSSWEGRWVLLFFDRLTAAEIPAALVDIRKSPKDGRLQVRPPVQFGVALSQPTLKQAQVSKDAVHLVLEMTVQSVTGAGQPTAQHARQADILVELHDGYARGDAQFGPTEAAVLVAMVPTELETIQELRPQMLPEAASLKLDKADQPSVMLDRTMSFIKTNLDSPLTVAIYPVVFRSAAERKADEASVASAAEQYVAAASRWGARQALKARIEIATNLVHTNYMRQIAIKQIDQTIGQLNEETIPIWKPFLTELKETAKVNEALAELREGTADQKARSIDLLRERDRKIPYDPIVLFELANYDEAQGKKETALHEYARLAVLPMFDEILRQSWKSRKSEHPPLRDSAAKLWKELHGSKLDGFDAYLDKVYADSMPKFTGRKVEARPADPENRVVLCELFTGASCSYCVAADVAFSHLLKTYAPTEMIALQYHEHIPQPDPLANADSEARFRFYFPDRGGTPTFAINGFPAQRGGLLHQAPDVYREIRPMIDHFLARRTTVKIQLSAQPKGSAVAVTADAEGSFPPNEPIHLRLALVEERVGLRGTNGIREHEMVVRSMPGGPQGVEIKDGKLHYQGTIDLKALHQELNDQLSADEEKTKMKFPSKPLDLSHLSLVAFVQNDNEAAREVYQAKIIPFPQPAGTSTAATDRDARKAQTTALSVDGKRP